MASANPISQINVGTPTNPDIRDIEDSRLKTATAQDLGIVKPDGTSITIDLDGTIHGKSSPFSIDSTGYINFTY